MKIAFFTDAYLPQTNGVVTHLLNIANSLSAKHDVLIIAPKPAQNIDTMIFSSPVKVMFMPSAPLTLYTHLRVTLPYDILVMNKVATFSPDIIHFHTPFTVGLNGIAYAKKNNLPLVGTFHTYFMEPEYQKLVHFDKIGLDKSRRFNQLLWLCSNLIYNRADVVVCPSKKTSRDLKKHGLEAPISVISNGIDLNEFKNKKSKKPSSAQPTPRLWPAGKASAGEGKRLPERYFLYVGRVSREKSIDIILKAFAYAFRHDRSSPHLVIVGEGPAIDSLRQLTQTLEISEKVQFVGVVTHSDLLQSTLYDNALAFVTASKTETQGITLLEAMAAGLPLIGVAAKATPELITNNGLLCKPDDITGLGSAMKQIAENSAVRKKFSKNSLKNVKKHSIDQTAEKLEEIYTGLINASGL